MTYGESMILNTPKRFLMDELERIEANLDWIDTRRHPGLVGEYERRYQIVCELLDSAATPEMVMTAVDERIQDINMLLGELDHAPTDPMRDALMVDMDYLVGLRHRLHHAMLANVKRPYALANVTRL
ncbi:MAG: hypothetical protein AAF125_16895 [Chloroflexota bacterium]